MVKILRGELLPHASVKHGFSTRQGGVSTLDLASLNLSYARGDNPELVTENRLRYFSALGGSDVHSAVYCQQVHSKNVSVVSSEHRGRGALSHHDGIEECDGLVTSATNLSLNIFTADCMAALFYDPVLHVAGACHAGWPGSGLGMVDEVVGEMVRGFGVKPANLIVAMGPCASWCCYEVDDKVVNALEFGQDRTTYLRPGKAGKYFLDLRLYNKQRLLKCGVASERIEFVGGCSICGEDFFSHRRQQGKAGRMLATIELLPRNMKD